MHAHYANAYMLTGMHLYKSLACWNLNDCIWSQSKRCRTPYRALEERPDSSEKVRWI